MEWNFISQTLRSPKISIQQQEMEASSRTVADIEELLTEILVRLPVNSLLRFKSVSKEWLSLISSPHFRDLSSKRFSNDISGIFLNRMQLRADSPVSPYLEMGYIPVSEDYVSCGRSSPMKRLDFLYDELGLEVVQYCNGLLLLRSPCIVGLKDRKYTVFNPSTKEYKTLSLNRVLESGELNPVSRGSVFFDPVSLAFDPRKSPHYKLICIYESEGLDSSMGVELGIYSSETGVLRQTDVHLQLELFCSSLYWNGAVNWINRYEDGLYFNVDEESLGPLPMLPRSESSLDESLDFGRNIMYYGESNDHLHLIDMDIPSAQFDVYEMDKGYSGWSVRFHVDLQPVLSTFSEEFYLEGFGNDVVGCYSKNNDYCELGVLAVVEKDDKDESFIVLSILRKALRYNLKNKSFTCLCDLDRGYGWKSSFQFTESLSRVQF